jgi:hypothetical protein
MAILLRTQDIPTRNVTGFVGGTYNRFGDFYAVRQGDAHSWVEVFIPGTGWVRFDPTPPANAAPQTEIAGVLALIRDMLEAAAQGWNRHVQDYDLDQQISLLHGLRRGLSAARTSTAWPRSSPRRVGAALLGLGLIGVAVWALRRRTRSLRPPDSPAAVRSPTAENAVALYQALEGALALRGVPRMASTPPLAHARALLTLGHPEAAEILQLTERYLEARFGQRPLDEPERQDFLRRVKALRHAAQRARQAA